MSDELLKSNFKLKNPVKIDDKEGKVSFREEYRKKALGSIGGSMVYMERENLTWDGEEEKR